MGLFLHTLLVLSIRLKSQIQLLKNNLPNGSESGIIRWINFSITPTLTIQRDKKNQNEKV